MLENLYSTLAEKNLLNDISYGEFESNFANEQFATQVYNDLYSIGGTADSLEVFLQKYFDVSKELGAIEVPEEQAPELKEEKVDDLPEITLDEPEIQSDVTSRLDKPQVVVDDKISKKYLNTLKNSMDYYISRGETDIEKIISESQASMPSAIGFQYDEAYLPDGNKITELAERALAQYNLSQEQKNRDLYNETIVELRDAGQLNNVRSNNTRAFIDKHLIYPSDRQLAGSILELNKLNQDLYNAEQDGDINKISTIKKEIKLASENYNNQQDNYRRTKNDPSYKAFYNLETRQRVDQDYVDPDEPNANVLDLTSYYKQHSEYLEEIKETNSYAYLQDQFDLFNLSYQDNQSKLNSTYNIEVPLTSMYGQALDERGYKQEDGVFKDIPYSVIISLRNFQNKTNGYLNVKTEGGRVGSRDIILQQEASAFGDNLEEDKEEIRNIEGQAMAWKDIFLLNRDPSSIKKSAGGVFLETLAESTVSIFGGDESVIRDIMPVSNDDRLQEIQAVMAKNNIKVTAKQAENFEYTRGQKISQAIGGILPAVGEFALLNAGVGIGMNITGLGAALNAIKTGKYLRNGRLITNKYFNKGIPRPNIKPQQLDKYLSSTVAANVVKQGGGVLGKTFEMSVGAAIEEGKMRFIGMEPGVGAGFYVAGMGFNGLAKSMGLQFTGSLAVLDAPLRLGRGGLSFVVGEELGASVSAVYEDIVNNKPYRDFVKEHYAHLWDGKPGEYAFDKFVSFLTGVGFGLTHLNRADLINVMGQNGTYINKILESNSKLAKKRTLSNKEKQQLENNNELLGELVKWRDLYNNTYKYVDVNTRAEDLTNRFNELNKTRQEQGKSKINFKIQKNSKGMGDRPAFFVDGKDGGTIVINAAKVNPGLLPHEVFHKLAQEDFKSDPAVFGKLRDKINKTVEKYLPTYQEAIKELYKDQSKETRPVEYFANLIELFSSVRGPYLSKNVYSLVGQDLLSFFENRLVGTRLEGLLPEIRTGEHVMDLIYRLSKSLKDGDPAAQFSRLNKIKLNENTTVEQFKNDLKRKGYEPPKIKEFASRNIGEKFEATESYAKLLNIAKDVSTGWEELSEAEKIERSQLLAFHYEPFIKHRIRSILNSRGFSNVSELKIEEIATKFMISPKMDGFVSIAKNYDPKIGDSMGGWLVNKVGGIDVKLNKFFREASLGKEQVFTDLKREESRGMEERIQSTAETTPLTSKPKKKKPKETKQEDIDLDITSDGLIITKPEAKQNILNNLSNFNFAKEKSLKSLEGRSTEYFNSVFGIKTKPGNLGVKDVKNALAQIEAKASAIETIMPEAYIPLKGVKDVLGNTYKVSEGIAGTGLNIRKSLPDLYKAGGVEGDKISEATGRVKTGAGGEAFSKIEFTNGKVIKDMLKIKELKNQDGSFNVDSDIARELSPRIKTIMKWLDKKLTSQVIRQNPTSLEFANKKAKMKYHIDNVLNDLAGGKAYGVAAKDIASLYNIISNKTRTIEEFIQTVNKSGLSKDLKRLVLDEVSLIPRNFQIESKETQELLKTNEEVVDKIELDASTKNYKSLVSKLAKQGIKININKTGLIEGESAYEAKINHDKKILKSLPAFETLPQFVQSRIMDQLGISYIKFNTPTYEARYNDWKSGKNKSKEGLMLDSKGIPVETFRLTRKAGASNAEIIREIYGENVLKGNGKKYKGEFDAANWQRKMSQKELTERGIDLTIESVKEGKSAEIKDIIADLATMYNTGKISMAQYKKNAVDILRHKNYTLEQTHNANKALMKAILKPFYDQYRKAKNKDVALSDIINHFIPLTNIGTSISKGFYTITSVPLELGKPFVNKKGKEIRTHNEHELQLFKFNEFFTEILTKSKNKNEFNKLLDRLIDMGEQSIIPKELQRFNDSKEMGGPTGSGDLFSGKLSGFSKLIFMTKKGVGDNQLYLLGDKTQTLTDFIIEKVNTNQIKKILDTFKNNEKTSESITLERKLDIQQDKLKVKNLKLAEYASKDISNSELISLVQQKAEAIAKARDINAKKKGASILDFDDTVAKSDSRVIVNLPKQIVGGKQYGYETWAEGRVKMTSNAVERITPAEFAKNAEGYESIGAKFDFSEFSKVIKGKKGPLFEKLQKIQAKYGTENTFILTARPASAAKPIHAFLNGLGVKIPLKNIIGLQDGRPAAKANFIVEKAAAGFNDFYFVDDAIKNVKAVKETVDLLGVNGKIRQAIEMSSKDLGSQFNKILQETTGVETFKVFSRAAAKARGADKGKWQFWLPPSAQGFLDLMYPTFGKGKQGNNHMKWFDEKLGRPYARGFYELNKAKQRIHDDYEALKKQYPDVKKIINKDSGYNNFNYDVAIRTYLWKKNKFDIPELNKTDISKLSKIVETDPLLKSFADQLSKITQLKEGYIAPESGWLAKSIQHDLLDISNKIGRKQFFKEWIDNKNEIFNENNLNKLEATFGTSYRNALEDMLYRMENGRNKTRKVTEAENQFSKWIGNATGTIMFLNRRSALLQTISAVNFVNWRDNNPLAVGKAFANQKQFWKDFAMIFNSPMLKQRRSGLTMDVNYEEIVNTVANKKDRVSAAVSYMLNKGFILTKYADNFAIAFGGAPFYRNRVNTYLKQGLDKKTAEKRAFLDFQETSEPTQQSSRPDLISQQQASPLGRFVLSFQNVTMQNNRNLKRAISDIKNKRGDFKTNFSKIMYYGAVQNLVFLGLQQALFASYWDEDATEEDINKKYIGMGNGLLDVFLRGGGMLGVGAATVKNTILKYLQESKKGHRMDEAKVIIEALGVSPPVSSKARKVYNAMIERQYNKDSIIKPSLLAAEGFTNVPFHEFYEMVDDVNALTTDQLENWQRLAIILGYPEWQVNIENNKNNKKNKDRKVDRDNYVVRETSSQSIVKRN